MSTANLTCPICGNEININTDGVIHDDCFIAHCYGYGVLFGAAPKPIETPELA